MTKLIALSDGHGINTSGKRTPTLPNGQKSETGKPYMNENLFNRAVIKYLDAELKRHGFKTLLVAPTDEDTPLETRTSLANKNKVDLYVSVHANANTAKWGNWGGIETFTWGSGESLRIGKLIHAELIKGSPLKDRGIKDGKHLWEIRMTNAPAVLVECGFMDSKHDYKYLLSDAYRKECAIEICKGICEAYGVPYKASTSNTAKVSTAPAKANTGNPDGSQTLYRVVVGSYADKKNANAMVEKLKKAKFNSFLMAFNDKGKTMYRVVSGSFSNKKNAEAMMALLKKAKFNSFIVADKK